MTFSSRFTTPLRAVLLTAIAAIAMIAGTGTAEAHSGHAHFKETKKGVYDGVLTVTHGHLAPRATRFVFYLKIGSVSKRIVVRRNTALRNFPKREARDARNQIEKYANWRVRVRGKLKRGQLVPRSITLRGNGPVERETKTGQKDFMERLTGGGLSALTGTKKVAVLMFNWSDNTSQPRTTDEIRQDIFTSTISTNEFFKAASFDAVALTGHERVDGDVFGWYTIPATHTDCMNNYSSWKTQVRNAATAQGKNLANYDYVIYAPASISGCPGSGWVDNLPDDEAWSGATAGPQTAAHELGHAFGLQHANRQNCFSNGARVSGGSNGVCVNGEYGDALDVMGQSWNYPIGPLLHAGHRMKLGWIPAANLQESSAFGDHTIKPLDPSAASGTKQLLRLVLPGGFTRYFDFRRPVGVFQPWAPDDEAGYGVTMRTFTSDPTDPTPGTLQTNIIHANPMYYTGISEYRDYGTINPGHAYYDPLNNLTFAVVSSGPSGAVLRYTNGSPAGPSSVTLSNGVLSIVSPAGQPSDISVTTNGGNVEVIDNGAPLSTNGSCAVATNSKITCPLASVTSIEASLGDMNDAIKVFSSIPATLDGGAGEDILYGGPPRDTIKGGAGNDRMWGGGGPGMDVLDYSERTEDLNATMVPGYPSITGIVGEQDSFVGPNNTFYGVKTGSGNDTVFSSGWDSVIDTGPGNDALTVFGNGMDIGGGSGTDSLHLPQSTDTTVTLDNAANDGGSGGTSNVRSSIESLTTGSGNDNITGTSGPQTIIASSGNDTIDPGTGNDTIDAGDGDDTVTSRDGNADSINCSSGIADVGIADSSDTNVNLECEQFSVVDGPAASITAGPANNSTITSTSTSFSFTSTPPAASFQCSVDAGAYQTCSSPKPLTGLSQGGHTFAVRALDAAQNPGVAASRGFTVDSLPPSISVTSPTEGQVLTSSTVNAVFTAGADSVGSTCRLDSGAISDPCTSPKSYTSVANGQHSVTVTARDAVGNVSMVVRSFSVAVNPAQLTHTTATASGNVVLSSAAVGPADWTHWGLSSATTFNRKSGVTAQISNYTKIGSGTVSRKTTGSPTVTWTGGTPTANRSSATATRIGIPGVNAGFRITVPANSTTLKTLKLHLGVYRSRGKLRAFLSDGGAPELLDTATTSSSGLADRIFTVNFRSQAATATLTVEWTMQTSNGSGSYVSMQAAGLAP